MAVSAIFVDFYSRLFTTSCPTDLERVLEGVQPVVSESMNEALTRPYVREEVDVAIQQMAPLKTPSLDGMPPFSFKLFGLILDWMFLRLCFLVSIQVQF